ncbi:MAG: hypothetical protein ACPGU1_17765 [Myxococcota bacterium]
MPPHCLAPATNLSRFVASTRAHRLLVHSGFFAAVFFTGLGLSE